MGHTRSAAVVATLAPVLAAALAQGPPKPRTFPPPEPAKEVVIRPGAVINLGIPDAPPPQPDGRPTQPGGQGGKPDVKPGGNTGAKPDEPTITNPNSGRPTQPAITNPNSGRPTQPGLQDAGGGAFPVAPGATPPDGISAKAPLRVATWAVWRRITDHGRGQPLFTMYALRASADGSRVAIGGYEGVRTMRADGSAYTIVTTKRTEDGNLDISADGNRVAWFSGDEGLFVANADGSSRTQLAAKGVCHSVRMSADGTQVFVINSEMDGIAVFPADGGPGRKLVTTQQAAQALGVDANGNHWRGGLSGLDTDSSGTKLVFHFLWDAAAVDLRDRTVRQLTRNTASQNSTLSWARLSADGAKVAWSQSDGPENKRVIVLQNWDGTKTVRHEGDQVAGSDWAQFAQDGARLATAWGLRLFPSDGSPGYNAGDLGSTDPLHRLQRASIAGNGRRCFAEVEEAVADGTQGCGQVYMVEFCPASLAGAPELTDIAIDNAEMKAGGGSGHLVTLRQSGAPLDRAGVVLVRPGSLAPPPLRGGMWDGLKDPDGQQPPATGPRPLVSGRLGIADGQSIAPGPVTIRLVAKDKEGRVTVVEVEGVTAK
jgi:hypothetical protein